MCIIPCLQSTKKTITSAACSAQEWGAEQLDWYIRSFKNPSGIKAAVRLAEKTCAFAEAFASLAPNNADACSSMTSFCGRAKVLGGTASTLLAIPANTRAIYRAWTKVATPHSSIYHLSKTQRILFLAKVTFGSIYLVCTGVSIGMKLFNYSTGVSRLGIALPYLKITKLSTSALYTTSGLSKKKSENIWRMELHDQYDKDPNLSESEKMILAEADLQKEKDQLNSSYDKKLKERQISAGLQIIKNLFELSSAALQIRVRDSPPYQQLSTSFDLISAIIGVGLPLYREAIIMRYEKEDKKEAMQPEGKATSDDKVTAARKFLLAMQADTEKAAIQSRLATRGITSR